jgi:hypothetical protein
MVPSLEYLHLSEAAHDVALAERAWLTRALGGEGYLGTIENKFGNYFRHPPAGRLQTLHLFGSVR